MENSKVYWTDLRTDPNHTILKKLDTLLRKSGMADQDFKDKYTALKIHFGEPGNMAFIRPPFVAVASRLVR